MASRGPDPSAPAERDVFFVGKPYIDRILEAGGTPLLIPHGVEHCPAADEETHLLLLEPKSTVNTGTTGGERFREATWI